jgi:hypothetical protein
VSGVLFVVSLPGSLFMQDVVKKILTFYRIVDGQNMIFDIFLRVPCIVCCFSSRKLFYERWRKENLNFL